VLSVAGLSVHTLEGFVDPWRFKAAMMCVCNDNNLMQYLSSVYSVTIPVHVSDLLVVHHQEVTMCMCNKWHVLYVSVDCQLATGPADSQLLSNWQARNM
jgi:hypothetical protein